ncbi:MAG TPA: tetratricopeptide repeat protein [Isosphaeraceae bacterium]|jgi:tetratricopeptide (TPR) repeat protein|nr:tetratricopeptide repeat protein [Isosphaeraceae bacterium]
MITKNLSIGLAILSALAFATSEARAGRGGGGGGRGGGGGGGGFAGARGGGMGGGAMGGMGGGAMGGGAMGGGGMGRGGGMPSYHAPTFSAPRTTPGAGFSAGGGINNGLRPGAGTYNRPTSTSFATGNRTPIGNTAVGGNRNVNTFQGGNRNTTFEGGNRVNNTAIGNRTPIGGNNSVINNRTNNNVISNRTDNNVINNRTNNNFINNGNNFNRGTNINNTNINVNNFNRGGNNFYGGGGYNGWGGRNPYWGYHQDWVHGYWNGHYNNWNWGSYGAGVATGFAAWGLGSMLYGWGYSNYANPYYYPQTVVVQQPLLVEQQVPVYDYSQPINTQAPLPDQTVADTAVNTFDDAREAFRGGDYPRALQLTDQALGKMPNDASLHEFRGLVLFALKQYDQAAASLYAVLSVGPGWDWTTLVGLYPNVDVYTEQLRALEAYCGENPRSAGAQFVLAYQYLTQGHTDNAAEQLKRVVQLQPGDKLSTQLLSQLTKSAQPAENAQQAPAEPQAEVAVQPGNLVGNWSATPAQGTTIGLTMKDGGEFTWKVTEKGQPREFSGQMTFGNDMLTLAQNEGSAMVGKVTWRDPNRFTFQVIGGGPADPGLTFTRN